MAYSKFNIRLVVMGKYEKKFLLYFKREFQKAIWESVGTNLSCVYDVDNNGKIILHKLPKGAYDKNIKKYNAHAFFLSKRDILLGSIKRTDSEIPLKVLILTNVGIYRAKREGRLFGVAEIGRDMAIVSTNGLEGDPKGKKSTNQRAIKEALHLLGYMLDLDDCKTPGCVMMASKTVEDIDQRNKKFCNNCMNKLYGGEI